MCEVCEGKRFDAAVLDYKLGGRDISEVLAMPVEAAREFFGDGEAKNAAALAILGHLVRRRPRLPCTLGQPLRTTLSGGEQQRLKLATHMSEKGGVYVLDEPTSGLHLADVEQLLGLLDRAAGRTRASRSSTRSEHHRGGHGARGLDHRPRPGAYHDGGLIVFEGTPAELVAARSTLTAQHLADYVTP